MKFIQFAGVILLFCATAVGCKTPCEPPVPVQATAQELSQMNREFIAALLAGNAAAAANLYTEDASLLPPNEPIVSGRANIEKYWQGLIDVGLLDGSVSTIATGSNGDLGYEIGTYELKIKGEGESVVVDKGKYTELLKRNAEGKWVSIYGMWSANEPPPSE